MKVHISIFTIFLLASFFFTGCRKVDPQSQEPEYAHFDTPKVTVNPKSDTIPLFYPYNPSVGKYLDEVNYPDNDYSYTLIQDYIYTPTSYRKDRPLPVTLPVDKDYTSRQIWFSPSDDPSSLGMTSIRSGEEYIEIYNLVPNRKYDYHIVGNDASGSKRLLKRSSFIILPGVRQMKIGGINNVRDLGGLRGDGGRTIRYGAFFRGGKLNGTDYNVTAEGKTELRAAKVAAELDFRRDDEAQNITSSPIGTDILYLRLPTTDKNDYTDLLKGNNYIKAFRWCIRFFQDHPNCAIYFHCAVGADRTGTMAFLIESLCGVSENDMSKDYELTSFSLPPGIRRRTTTPYDYSGMVALVKSFKGSTMQEKVYNYLTAGMVAGGDKIGTAPVDSVAWLRDFLLVEDKVVEY